ncbi:hypothetical protein PGB34_20620 [Xenophilus arseniciresistens]|uniref:Type VI secretion system component TssM1 N-terminal domain-containing protein n=1 Tax=Xenophilus arseniciresistens TaxID=1283306 RepID=A0AAE3N9Z3_9BURK|nr:type VI secretion protein IcmF/TssM N-terminal domain-containing protein [Xenophilus arseniciresistens]MDA7418785.1 hypothetical protein [Xenophilus arseniciresistens]
MNEIGLAGLGAMGAGIALLGWLAWREGWLGALIRWRRWHERLTAARRRGQTASAPSVRALRAAITTPADLETTWQPLPHPPHHALPRLLWVGDAASALPALLSAVAPEGPVKEARVADEEPFWRWWWLPQQVAIEVCPPAPPPEAQQDLLWLHALRTLAQTQPQRPLEGMVLCISVALLRADPKVAETLMQLLARRAHESATLLSPRLPLYLLVTGLQDLPGYGTVRAATPAPVLQQAFGWRAPPEPVPQPWQAAHDTWQPALHAWRLGLMARSSQARERHDIHRFAEALLALTPGLHRLEQALALQAGTGPRLQGLYFTASAPQPAFLADLFERFLNASDARVN